MAPAAPSSVLTALPARVSPGDMTDSTMAVPGRSADARRRGTGRARGGGFPAPNPDPARYTVAGRIARGGMGEVWRVHDRLLDRSLALKLMYTEAGGSDGLRERFRYEARVTARRDHPGGIPILDAGEAEDGRLWYLMREVANASTLRPRIEAACPWGDLGDPSWCAVRDSAPGRPMPRPVDSFPVDEGPTGVRGLAGNMHDWCENPFEPSALRVLPETWVVSPATPEDRMRVTRGGAYGNEIRLAQAAYYVGDGESYRDGGLSFRFARSLP